MCVENVVFSEQLCGAAANDKIRTGIDKGSVMIDILIYTKLPASFRKNPYVPQWIELLKCKIGLRCSGVLIEYPYYDSEYLSSYYQYYVKKFHECGKKVLPYSFFQRQLGMAVYITVSPVIHYSNLSKSYLSPERFA